MLDGAIATGHLQDAALARAVASADVMLTASTTETFGNVVLEAMASGLAVVSADAPSARALLSDGQTGLLCPPFDIESYVAAIEALVHCADHRCAISAAAVLVAQAYTWDDVSAAVDHAYCSVISSYSTPGATRPKVSPLTSSS